MKSLTFLCFLIITISLSAQNLSNKGKEFWVGYGHNNLFTGQTPLNSQRLVLYLSAEQAATVTISVNGTTFSQTYNIPANTVIETVEIPKAGATDARLTVEGLSNRGIHIVSDVPIVAYAHQYGSNSSGATMLMPVETYGNTYYSLNYTQITNSTPAYSWFFVVASENNTRVEITPSAATQGGRPANVAFTVNLSKGQIYNVFGQSFGSNGNDLTGSKIKSVAGGDGICHPIGVFSGASRMTICGNSGDFMQQQIFPASAWGTQYLTYSTVSYTNTSTPNRNFYRLAVRDPSTIVTKNGAVLTGLINGFYYDFESNDGDYIEADKPILVGQFMPSSNCTGYQGGTTGDPEMFYLSPLEQAIKKASFYSTSNQGISKGYVSIIVKSAGMSSLTVDGSNVFDYVTFHPQNRFYTVVVTSIGLNQQHTIESDSSFTAITYGMGSVESYGYNAGTLINNLDIVPTIQNTLSQGGGLSTSTCPKSPFKLAIQLAYKPTEMIWHFSQVNNISPNTDTTLVNPVPSDSSFVGPRKYYEYRLPRDYSFSDTGTYNIPITITAPEIDNCNNTLDVVYTIKVNPSPKPDFTFTYSGCISDTASLFGSGSAAGYNIYRYKWLFDDATVDSLQNVKKKFSTQGTHLVKYTVIADNGCVGDTIKPVTTSPAPIATFGMSPLPACEGNTITFSDTSSFGGTLQSWYWDFGNGQTLNAPNNNPVTSSYPVAGNYIVKHFAQASGGCRSDTSYRSLQIFAKPAVNFGMDLGCLQDSTVQFHDSTTIADGQSLSYLWNFGDVNATASNPNTSVLQNPTHRYSTYNTYPVNLRVTTANGCVSNITKSYTVTGFGSTILFDVQNENALCAQALVNLTNRSNVSGDSVYRIDIYWDVANQPLIFQTDNTPTGAEVYSHQYATFTTPATKTVTIKWIVYSKGSCVSERSKTITLIANPALQYPRLPGVCLNNSPTSIATASVLNGITGTGVYSGPGTTAAGIFNPPVAGAGVHTVSFVFTSTSGCKDSITQTIRVFPKPIAKFGYASNVCAGDSVLFRDSSTIHNQIVSWNWNFGDGITLVRNDSLPFYHNYSTGNNYSVKLFVVSDSACVSDTFTKVVTVYPKPVADFTVSPLKCVGTNVTFTPTAGAPGSSISSWYYDFGNGQTATFNNSNPVTGTYLTAGTYLVRHYTQTSTGCKSDTVSKTITIYANPVANFNFNTGCLVDSTVNFTNLSTVSDGQLLTYLWNFNDPNATASNPNTATTINASHKYTAYGIPNVSLTVTTGNGCVTSLIRPYNIPGFLPSVNYSVQNENALCVTNIVQATNQTNVTPDSVYRIEIYWDFLNQPTTFTTDNTPTNGEIYQHQYPLFTTPASRTFTIRWVVYSKGNCVAEKTKTITLYTKPQLTFATPAGRCINAGTSSIAIAAVTNGAVGSGYYAGPATDSAGNFNPAVAGVGLHTIKYVFVPTAGCSDSISTTIRVFPKPTAGFIYNRDVCLNDSTLFQDSSSIAGGRILSWNWNFADGSGVLIKNNNSNFYKTFATYGVYNVRLYTVSDSACVSDTFSKAVTVFPSPVADFTLPAAVCIPGGEAKFTNLTTMPAGFPSPITYAWNFGDGGSSTATDPTHFYSIAQPYTVTLRAISAQGCFKDTSKLLTTFKQKPTAAIGIANTTFCTRQEVRFIDSSVAGSGSTIIQYNWSFGDGSTSSNKNPLKIYNNAGTFSISLVVTSSDGCVSDTVKRTIVVSQLPLIDAGPDLMVDDGKSITLLGQVSGSITGLRWTPRLYLNNVTVARPIATPSNTTIYKLTATGQGNCAATDSMKLTVLKTLVVPNAFSPNGDGINDVLNIKYLAEYPRASIEFFNRYGQPVYRSFGYTKPWDGTYNGKPVPVGVYYYIIDLKQDGYSKLSGSITILR